MQNQNQFDQTPEQGQLDLRMNPSVIAAQIDSSEAGSLVAGQAVKLVDSAGGVPKVIACTADADDVYGFIAYNIKNRVFTANMAVEIAAMRDNVMYMTSSAAIARGAQVAIVVVGNKVVTGVTGDRVVGRAYDKATAADQLIRVTIDLPGALVP